MHRLAIELEAPVRAAAFGLEAGAVSIVEGQRGAVLNRRLAQRAGAGAAAIELVFGFIARVEAA